MLVTHFFYIRSLEPRTVLYTVSPATARFSSKRKGHTAAQESAMEREPACDATEPSGRHRTSGSSRRRPPHAAVRIRDFNSRRCPTRCERKQAHISTQRRRDAERTQTIRTLISTRGHGRRVEFAPKARGENTRMRNARPVDLRSVIVFPIRVFSRSGASRPGSTVATELYERPTEK